MVEFVDMLGLKLLDDADGFVIVDCCEESVLCAFVEVNKDCEELL